MFVPLALVGAHCEDKDPAGDRCNMECVIEDPVPHEISYRGCESSRQCPAGSLCLPPRTRDPELPRCENEDLQKNSKSCVPEDVESIACENYRECQVPYVVESSYSVLIDGFGEGVFRLEPVSDRELVAYDYSIVAEVRVVVCGLFVCPPIVEEVARKPKSVLEIVNLDQCLVARDVFSQSSGVFDLENPGIFAQKPKVDPSLSCGTDINDDPWTVTQLTVGCWAYDDSHLIAATPLLLVDHTRFRNNDLIVDDCAGNDGHTCLIPVGELGPNPRPRSNNNAPVFGTCFSGACHERCTHSSDCNPAPPSHDEPCAGGEGGEGGEGGDTGQVTQCAQGGQSGEGAMPAVAADARLCDRSRNFVGVCVPGDQCPIALSTMPASQMCVPESGE